MSISSQVSVYPGLKSKKFILKYIPYYCGICKKQYEKTYNDECVNNYLLVERRGDA